MIVKAYGANASEEQYCDNGFTGTYNGPLFDGETYGGYSQSIVVKESVVLRIRHAESDTGLP